MYQNLCNTAKQSLEGNLKMYPRKEKQSKIKGLNFHIKRKKNKR